MSKMNFNVIKRKDRKFYSLRYKLDGIVYEESLKTDNKRVANNRAAIREREILKDRVTRLEYGITLEELKELFMAYLNTYASDRTITITEYNINCLIDFLGGQKRIKQITKNDGIKYMGYLKDRYKPRSVNSHIIRAKVMFNWAMQDEYIDKNPFQYLKAIKVMQNEFQPLSKKQIGRLLEDAKNRNIDLYYIVNIILNTGMRITEVLNLKVTDIQNGYISVQGKGTRRRYVKINAQLDDILKEIPNRIPTLFKMSQTTASIAISSLLDKQGIPGAAHLLRKTFISNLLMAGVDISAVAEIVGHTHINSLIRDYARFYRGHLDAAVDKLPYNS